MNLWETMKSAVGLGGAETHETVPPDEKVQMERDRLEWAHRLRLVEMQVALRERERRRRERGGS